VIGVASKKGTQSDIHGDYKLLECFMKIAV
jgi:hypothetical protein